MMGAADVTDDVLIAVFKTLAAECAINYGHKQCVARFIWIRTNLPLVCKRWYRLALDTPTLWRTLIIDPTLEVQHVKRLGRTAEAPSSSTARDVHGGSGSTTPARGGSPILGSSPDSDAGSYWSSIYAPQQAGDWSYITCSLFVHIASIPDWACHALGFCLWTHHLYHLGGGDKLVSCQISPCKQRLIAQCSALVMYW